jgi:hypothetical protein
MFNWVMGIGAAGATVMFWRHQPSIGWAVFVAAIPFAYLADAIFGK